MPTEQIDQLVQAYRDGVGTPELHRRYGVSKGSVLRLLHDHGVTIRRQGLTDEQITEAARLYKSGQSLAKIGTHFGVDHGTVWRALRKRGVQLRDTHGRER